MEKDKCETCEHHSDKGIEYCGSCGSGVESNWSEARWIKDKRIQTLEQELGKLRGALEKMLGRYKKIQDIMRKHNLKYDNSKDPMQKLFFTTYTEVVEMEEIAKTALEKKGVKDG